MLLAGKGEDLTVDLLPSHGVHVVVAAVASLGAKPSPLRTIAFVPNRRDGPRSLRRNVDRSSARSFSRPGDGRLAHCAVSRFRDVHRVALATATSFAVRVRSAGTNLGRLGGFAPPTNKRFVAALVPGCRREAVRALGDTR